MKYVIYLRKKRQNNKMINTQGREVPQPEGISRATYEEKTGVKDRYLQSEDSQEECHCNSKHAQIAIEPELPKNITRELQ